MNETSVPSIFKPPLYLRNAMLQTFLGSNRFGGSVSNDMLASSCPITLRTPDDVTLSGALSTVNLTRSMGLVILLHGWEGSIDSTYIVTTGRYLFRHGFSVFRLNLRDHGDSHSLNKGLFYATLLDEVYEAVIAAARMAENTPVFLCGFSLGGNFALRIARKWSQHPEENIRLKHITAISPVLDPSKATDAIDARRHIRSYFLRKWQRSLRLKQHFFPSDYDFGDIVGMSNIRLMTEMLLRRHSSYQNAEAYFSAYNLCGHSLDAISIPTTIITSKDDPIIPVEDFYDLSPNPHLHITIHPFGGHNGFVCNLLGRTWYEKHMLNTFRENRQQPATEGVPVS